MLESTLNPAMRLHKYPQQLEPASSWLDRTGHRVSNHSRKLFQPQTGILALIEYYLHRLESAPASSLLNQALQCRKTLLQQGFSDDAVARSFALISHAAQRILHKCPYPVQRKGGLAILRGNIAEMATGEGKTLTATLPACTAALAGLPVHIITTNDYLAQRDAETLRPLYESLGLSVAAASSEQEDEQRRHAYQQDIAYCTNKQLAFDYLHDRILLKDRGGDISSQLAYLKVSMKEKIFLRGLHFAIIDEADSVLIDEAKTPLIIARQAKNQEQNKLYADALSIARKLQPQQHFTLQNGAKSLVLTAQGRQEIAKRCDSLGSAWRGEKRRNHLLAQALRALHGYHRDKDYLLSDEQKIEIIDSNTGRRMPERAWELGLQQLIECKEGCPISQQQETLARITYQRFFRRYLHLGGMTGTISEVSSEISKVYGLHIQRIPRHKALVRKHWPQQILPDSSTQLKAIMMRVIDMNLQGRPVLIGTRSVARSEQLSRLLKRQGIEHQVLNANQDQHEATIIAQAGQRNKVTVATNMAGRGIDIELGPGVADLGGLHVIVTELNPAKRIDRQLIGRSSRQGDPGSCETLLSLDDELIAGKLPAIFYFWLQQKLTPSSILARWLATKLIRLVQIQMERENLQSRRLLLAQDLQLTNQLDMSGTYE